jgi:hypothetical protein
LGVVNTEVLAFILAFGLITLFIDLEFSPDFDGNIDIKDPYFPKRIFSFGF